MQVQVAIGKDQWFIFSEPIIYGLFFLIYWVPKYGKTRWNCHIHYTAYQKDKNA